MGNSDNNSEYKSNPLNNYTDFQEFIDLLPEIIYELDLNGKLTLVNKAGLNILGYTKEDFEKGLYVFDIVSSEEKEFVLEHVKKLFENKKSIKFEYHAVKKDGTKFPVSVNAFPVIKNGEFIGTRGIVIDLTEQKQIENKLKDANDFLNTTINAMQEPFFVKDENHKWVILNDSCVELIGQPREELIGKSDYDVFPKEQADVFWEKDDYVFKNGSNTNVEEITNSKGEIRTIITNKVLYSDKITGRKYIVGTIHDITDLREAELKLKKYSEELEEINKNKDKLFSVIAHDLRNPFTSIYGFSSVLSEEFDTLSKEEIKEYINYIYTGTKSIYDLIENLLTWSRMQTGGALVQPIKLDMYSKVQDAIGLLNVFAKNKRIKLINSVEKNIYAFGDSNMVDSVLQNLISNAIKFTKASGIVKISSTITDDFVEISVCDSGIGMSKDEMDNLLQLGKQKSKKNSSEEQGTGLGLIICKEMLSKMNGSLKVESELNKGSIFTISLPKV